MLVKLLVFIDYSTQFMNSTLGSLVKYLSENNFSFLFQEGFFLEKLGLVKRKGFYGYECISSFEKIEKGFPEKCKSYSSLER